jgi:hypothetical protein
MRASEEALRSRFEFVFPMSPGETGTSDFCWAVSVLGFTKPEVEGPTCLPLTRSSGAASVSVAFGSTSSLRLARPKLPRDEVCIGEYAFVGEIQVHGYLCGSKYVHTYLYCMHFQVSVTKSSCISERVSRRLSVRSRVWSSRRSYL